MVRIKEYHFYKDDEDYVDSDLNLFARTFGLKLIKTEQLGEFKDYYGNTFYKVLAYFEIPEELKPLEEFISDCCYETDENGRRYTDCQKLDCQSKKAMKDIFGDRISFEDIRHNDKYEYTWIYLHVK